MLNIILNYVLFPTQLLTSEDECKWFWHQMIYFPGTINIVSTWLHYHIYIHCDGLTSYFPLCTSTYSVHEDNSELWRGRLPWFPAAFPFHWDSRLAVSCVRVKLTLPVLAGAPAPYPTQNGVLIHRVRTHPFPRVRHTYLLYWWFFVPWCTVSENVHINKITYQPSLTILTTI